ncbi:hypothetical protein AAG570_007595 [Ranatra chinensis]|uniref:Laminin G domain-containing protein n=1 Tax=Ranatra chinensis TaxID=642074 RepID=A0ABD0XU05_9HEMI
MVIRNLMERVALGNALQAEPQNKPSGTEVRVRWPRFWGQGWLAFPALKAAYKHVQLEIEFRPQSPNGILFLTGERDDLAGDFMALLIYKGFVEFRFDCGSGVGVVKSDEKVMLNRWNRITLYRHRWDASVQLNSGNHVQGRSKGLFSRMTFREPVFIGGRGNTSGLQEKLPTDKGLKGCIRHLQINDYVYNFAPVPRGDAVKGFDIEPWGSARKSTGSSQILGYVSNHTLHTDLDIPAVQQPTEAPVYKLYTD